MSPITNTEPITPAVIARPGYKQTVDEPGFGTRITRICGDNSTAIDGIPGSMWGKDARHGYSRRNPANCDGTLCYIEQRSAGGGRPSRVLLDMKTWGAIKSGNDGIWAECDEVRWHPYLTDVMIGWNRDTLELVRFSVIRDEVGNRVPVGLPVSFMGEGSLSNNGQMVALGNEQNLVVVVHVDAGKVGAAQTIDFIHQPGQVMGNLSVSPLSTEKKGRVVCKASNEPELVHVFDYDDKFVLTSKFESDLTLSHGDVGSYVNPVNGLQREVFVGGAREWLGKKNAFNKDDGRICAIDLETGAITHISVGTNQLPGGADEAADQHCSARASELTGEVCVTYAGPQETDGTFTQEIVLYKLDGSKQLVRMGVTRTNETLGDTDDQKYRNEAHACQVYSQENEPRKVIFASNWQHATTNPGDPNDVKSYFLTTAESGGGATTPPAAGGGGYRWVEAVGTYVIMDSRNLVVHPDDVVKLMNANATK